MDNRKFALAASATPPTPPASPSVGYPTDGDPLAPIPATVPGAFHLYQLGEELRNVITAAGLTPSTADLTQTATAIQKLIEARVGDFALDTGTANAKVVALNPPITAYTGNFDFAFKNLIANGGATVINFGGGDVSLANDVGAALAANDLVAGMIVRGQYIQADGKAYITSIVASQAITQAQADARYLQIVNARDRLVGGRTLYVSTTGNDANSGLSAGSPFLTIQKAISTIYDLYDLNGNTVTIQLADGTYTAGGIFYGMAVGQKGPSQIVISGNLGAPTNVILSCASICLQAQWGAQFTVQYLKLQNPVSGNSLLIYYGARCLISAGVSFGAVAAGGYSHMAAQYGGEILITAAYTIYAGATYHWFASYGGRILCSALSITLIGVPAFYSGFASANDLSEILCNGNTFTGSATGNRYGVTTNSLIQTNGGGANYLPGNVAGSTATGGQYV